MARKISNYVNQSMGPRRVARIVTVDTATRTIEGQLKDGGLIQISVFDVPSFFVWPAVGESWIVRQDMGFWKLFNKFDAVDDTKIDSLGPGEAKIGAEIIKTPSGKTIVTVAETKDSNWIPLELTEDWIDVSTLNAEEINNYGIDTVGISTDLLDLIVPASYYYDSIAKRVYFRGIVFQNENVNESIIAEIPYKIEYDSDGIEIAFNILGLNTEKQIIHTQSSNSPAFISLSGFSFKAV